MRQLATIVALALTLNCTGQLPFDNTKISQQTQRIVAKIDKVNQLMGSAVSYADIRPQQFDNFTALRKNATKVELTELTNHPNGVVRCYAFWALSYDSTANLLPIAINHIGDTALVTTYFGCILSGERVGDFFINVITPRYVDTDSKKLTSEEYKYLDSVLIYTSNNLNAKFGAIERAKTNDAFYSRTRELVLKERNQSALVALAKFRREEDIPLILNNKLTEEKYDQYYFTYKAISEFPHTAFLPFLKKSLQETLGDDHYSTEWSELYNAIASYKNDTALQLLKIPFTKVKHEDIRKYHIDYVFSAVQQFYAPVYDDLLWKMWEHEKKIAPGIFNLLYPKDPEKGLRLTKKTIQNADDFYYSLDNPDYDENGGPAVNLLDVMLDTVLLRDRDFAIECINKNIRQINVHQFPLFADKALAIKDSSFITSLLARLETEDNAHIYLKATEILIAFADNNINDQILKISKRNQHLKQGWGGKSFAALLKKNNIN